MSIPDPFHPDCPHERHERTDSVSPAVDPYLDARGAGRPAKSMLDAVCRDSSVLDALARDREWIDEVRSPASVPDQTGLILNRLGVEMRHFDRRRHRFVLLSRRLCMAAVLVLAFVVGMWARSALVPAPATRTFETANRLERVIKSLPTEMDPFDRVRNLILEVGATLAGPDSAVGSPNRPARAARRTAPDAPPNAPVRAGLRNSVRPELAPSGLINQDIDAESPHAIYRDMGIV